MNTNPRMMPIAELLQLYDIIQAYEKLKEHNLLTNGQIKGFERLKSYVNQA